MTIKTFFNNLNTVQAELPPLKIKVNAPEKKNKTKQKSNNTDPEMLDSPDLFEPQTHSGNHFLSAQIPIKEEIQDDESEASVAAGKYIKEVALAEAMVSPVWPGQASLSKVHNDSNDSGFTVS